MPRRKRNAAHQSARTRSPVKPAGKCWLAQKYSYRTENEANAALADVRQRRRAAGVDESAIEKRSYFHTVCQRWHLTRETEGEYNAARESWSDDQE